MSVPPGWIALGLTLSLVACHRGQNVEPAPTPAPTALTSKPLRELLSEELLLQANGGRQIFDSEGLFAFPEGVTRVWIDVGAHHLETFRDGFLSTPSLALIAVEPLAECWETWPREDPRLFGIPAAIYLERGFMDFHVNEFDATSSLAESVPGSSTEELTRTVEVRKVPVVRLEDVLAAVPAHIAIAALKTDVQGVDLQVLRSGGELLRRVAVVKTEVINEALYKKLGEEASGTEEEFVTYMTQMGFRFEGDHEIAQERRWLDKLFINNAFRPPPPSAPTPER
jgi:FkbM family methyltransferase